MNRTSPYRRRKLVLAGVLAALAFAGFAAVSLAQNDAVRIETSVGTLGAFQCSPCHINPDSSGSGRILFRHSYHLLYRCDSCHPLFTHQPGKTIRPSMQTCFICHGINHGTQKSLASGKCSSCHPAGSRREPGTHTAAWKAGKGHKKVTLRQTIDCMMCHSGQQCENCHAKKKVKPRPVDTYFFEYEMPSPTSGANIDVVLNDTVGLGNCSPCHLSLDSFRNSGLIFRHEEHLKRGIDCFGCHEKFPHVIGNAKKPAMKTCYKCHGVNHGTNGLVATAKCAACHPKSFKLMPVTHTKAWKAKGHKKDVKRDPQYCMMCHDAKLCQRCHNKDKVKPVDHKAKEAWRKGHGVATADIGQCTICHKDSYCTACHKTRIPHVVTWVRTHKLEGRKRGAACKMCHYQRGYCSDCHHIRSLERRLALQTCVKCHPVLKAKPSVIRLVRQNGKALLVHKYHFEMTKTKPFKCQVCHEGGISKAKDCFNFTLCYNCHGKYEDGRLIAKWGGKELCFRCHPNQRRLII